MKVGMIEMMIAKENEAEIIADTWAGNVEVRRFWRGRKTKKLSPWSLAIIERALEAYAYKFDGDKNSQFCYRQTLEQIRDAKSATLRFVE